MVNRIRKCTTCNTNSIKSIYYRDEEKQNRPYKVAFLACTKCSSFFDFWDVKQNRIMPYYNEIRTLFVRLVKDDKMKEKLFLLRMDVARPCVVCSKTNTVRLYLRRNHEEFEFVGYMCRNCATAFFVNRIDFKLKTMDPKGYYDKDGRLPPFHGIPFSEFIGSFVTSPGAPLGDEGIKYVKFRLEEKKLSKLKRALAKAGIDASSLQIVSR